jgi:hypothetical protein
MPVVAFHDHFTAISNLSDRVSSLRKRGFLAHRTDPKFRVEKRPCLMGPSRAFKDVVLGAIAKAAHRHAGSDPLSLGRNQRIDVDLKLSYARALW